MKKGKIPNEIPPHVAETLSNKELADGFTLANNALEEESKLLMRCEKKLSLCCNEKEELHKQHQKLSSDYSELQHQNQKLLSDGKILKDEYDAQCELYRKELNENYSLKKQIGEMGLKNQSLSIALLDSDKNWNETYNQATAFWEKSEAKLNEKNNNLKMYCFSLLFSTVIFGLVAMYYLHKCVSI